MVAIMKVHARHEAIRALKELGTSHPCIHRILGNKSSKNLTKDLRKINTSKNKHICDDWYIVENVLKYRDLIRK